MNATLAQPALDWLDAWRRPLKREFERARRQVQVLARRQADRHVLLDARLLRDIGVDAEYLHQLQRPGSRFDDATDRSRDMCIVMRTGWF